MVYPKTLLTLQKGFSSTSTTSTSSKLPPIAVAAPGTNCHQACTSAFTSTPACDPVNSASITSMSTLQSLFPGQWCKPGASLSTCSPLNPMLNDTAGGLCSFNSDSCSASSTSSGSTAFCEQVDPFNHRICYCTTGSSEATVSSTNNPGSTVIPPSSSSNSKSSGSSFPTVPVAVSVSIGSVVIFGLFIAYGLFRRQQFADTNKMTSDVTMQPMQVARPVMPEGRI